MTLDPWQLDATELAARIRRHELSARAATEATLARIAAVNPRWNALTVVCTDEALAAADAADRALDAGEAPGVLHGVPVTIKDNIDMAGHATTEGVVAWRDRLAPGDSPVVANLRRAGAVIVGRSNVPAFGMRWFTDNELFGRTLNPYDPAITPGGSSGGAAVAVASGMGPIAHANDLGGSIRYPAYCCGVVGLRTTAGRIPSYKPGGPGRSLGNQQMSVQGPITRSVRDARLALQVMAQGSALDPQWTPVPLAFGDEAPGVQRPLRIAVCASQAGYDVHPGVRAAVEQAAAWLAQAGCEVVEAAPPHFEEAAELWRTLMAAEATEAGRRFLQAEGDAATRAILRAGDEDPAPMLDREGYLAAQQRRFDIARDWSVLLDEHDVLLMPVSWQPPFPIDADTQGAAGLRELRAAQRPLLATALLGLPGLAVPTGMLGSTPVGVQLIAMRWREDRCLAAGELIERAAGFDALRLLAGV